MKLDRQTHCNQTHYFDKLTRAGGNSGYSNTATPAAISGFNGGWTEVNPILDASGSPVAGILCMRSGYGASGLLQFTRRDGTTRPTGAWDMAGQNVTNINTLGSTALNNTGAAAIGGALGVAGQTNTNGLANTGNVTNSGTWTNSGKQTAHYDAADRLIKTTNANGNQTEYVYNAAGQIILRVTKGKNSSDQEEADSVSYRYEGQYLKSVANRHQTTDYTYDLDGSVVQTVTCLTRPQATALCFTNKTTYDALGRVQSETLASGETIQFSYDQASRPINMELVSKNGRAIRTLAKDIQTHPFAGITAFTHGNGLTTRREYNQNTGQLTRLSVFPTKASALYTQNITYDIAGRITGITRRGNHEQYGYNNFDHLSQVNTPHEKTTWRYDTVGNRLTQSQDHTLTYKPASNQLTAINQAQNQVHYHYDAAGNPTQIGQKDYGYDVTGRLQQVSQSGKVLAQYAYNAQGERISKTVINANGQADTTYFLYHGHQLDAEMDATGTVRSHYVYLNHIPIAKIEYPPKPQTEPSLLTKTIHWLGLGEDETAGRINAIHTDHLGTPQLVTDDQQKIVWQANYTAFGKATVTTQSITLNLRMPGQYFDQETGTHYNYFRDYEPETGRYLTSDPIGLAGGMNTYSYVGGNPILYADPLGLLVNAILDKKKNTLTFTDVDTGKSVTVNGFTGGHASPDGTIVSPGTGLESPAPNGSYMIVDNPNPKLGHEDWYGLFKNDERIDDYFMDNGKQRSGVRLHLGGISHGCVTVNKYGPDGTEKWKEIRELLNNTKKGSVEFIMGPYWWNSKGKTTHYGTMTIK